MKNSMDICLEWNVQCVFFCVYIFFVAVVVFSPIFVRRISKWNHLTSIHYRFALRWEMSTSKSNVYTIFFIHILYTNVYKIYDDFCQLEHANRIIEVNALHFFRTFGRCVLYMVCNFILFIFFLCHFSFCVFVFHSFCFVLFWFDFSQQKTITITTTTTTTNASETADKTTEERAHCFKHLSKSASELDSHESYTNLTQPSPTPQRRTVAGVLQRTHGFLSTLKVIIAIIYRHNCFSF